MVNPSIFAELAMTRCQENSQLLPSSFSSGLSGILAKDQIGHGNTDRESRLVPYQGGGDAPTMEKDRYVRLPARDLQPLV